MFTKHELTVLRREMGIEKGLPVSHPDKLGTRVERGLRKGIEEDGMAGRFTKAYARGALHRFYGRYRDLEKHPETPWRSLFAYYAPKVILFGLAAACLACMLTGIFSAGNPETFEEVHLQYVRWTGYTFIACLAWMLMFVAVSDEIHERYSHVLPGSIKTVVYEVCARELMNSGDGNNAYLWDEERSCPRAAKEGLSWVAKDPSCFLFSNPLGRTGWLRFWHVTHEHYEEILRDHFLELAVEKEVGHSVRPSNAH